MLTIAFDAKRLPTSLPDAQRFYTLVLSESEKSEFVSRASVSSEKALAAAEIHEACKSFDGELHAVDICEAMKLCKRGCCSIVMPRDVLTALSVSTIEKQVVRFDWLSRRVLLRAMWLSR